MSIGQLAIRLTSQERGTGYETLAMAEVTAAPRSNMRRSSLKIPLGVNYDPGNLSLDAGSYLVRLFLPDGDVQAERVEIRDGSLTELTFDVGKSPNSWLGAAASVGIVQTLPRMKAAKSLKAMLSWPTAPILRSGPKAEWPTTPMQFGRSSKQSQDLASRAVLSLNRSTREIERISGRHRVAKSEGWRWVSQVDPARAFPECRLSATELARWWTGNPVSVPIPLNLAQSDERNARLMLQAKVRRVRIKYDKVRAFAAVRDPIGGAYYAVFPEGWNEYEVEGPSVLLTVTIESAMTSKDSPSFSARWRCAPEVDDVAAMSLLGYLHTNQIKPSEVLLAYAHRRLFEKFDNPVAAAAGAYLLVSHSEEANVQLSPDWRRWVSNLFNYFPHIPDGAIAMAQMAMNYGETQRDDEIDVERLRVYVLEAVRRGLPYFGTGIRRLTELLVALEGDDRAEGRSGKAVESTRQALSLVRQLGRITVPGEFFTVLRLDEERA